MTCQKSWSCDPDAADKLLFPYPLKRHINLGFDVVSEKTFEELSLYEFM